MKRAARSGEPVLAVESAAAIVRKARELKIPSDPEHAAVVGRAFLRIANNDRGTIPAMDTVQELLGYRSFLLPPVFDDPDRGIVAHNAMLMLSRLHDFQPLKSESQIYGYIRPFRGMETSNATARLNILGRSNSILPVDAYQAVLTEGYEVKIDGLDARNIAFNNCKIIYSGGSLILENVYFSNCTFELDKSGMEFAAAALSSSGEVSLVKR